MTNSMGQAFRATAPGKLILVGEYAVLEGAAAISAAVDRFAAANLVVSSGRSELRIANTGDRFPFSHTDGAVDWHADPGIYGDLLIAALDALRDDRAAIRGLPPFEIELCTRQFYSDASGEAQKIGVGSSAALTVAVVAALQACMGETPTLRRCLAAHRILQHGTGSGVDIATSWHGGVIAVRPDAVAPAVESLRWPEGFYLRPVWSGNAASTTGMLARLKAFGRGSPQAYEALMTKLSDGALAAQAPWRASRSGELFEALQDYGELLRELDEKASIGIWSDGHRRLRSLAQTVGVGYKPSGAGGGDFGLAFSADAERLNEFARQADESVVKQPVELHWTQDGLISGVAAG
ncbi:MAG: hypothetical protein P8Y61_01270 [Gammaproteobacteria bacterium]|jgi:phosphomevalonate kinase